MRIPVKLLPLHHNAFCTAITSHCFLDTFTAKEVYFVIVPTITLERIPYMSEQHSKSNKQFMILSAIAIFFVVDAHAMSPFYIMANLMPYNSFFMPLFAFISGYFFSPKKLDKLPSYLLSRVKKLLLPFFVWNLLYGILTNLLRYFGII